MSCECYPPDKYPAYLRKGCSSASQCRVVAEMRQCKTPEGRAEWMENYHHEAALAAGVSDLRPRPKDVYRHVQRLGVPSQALFALDGAQQTEPLKASKSWWQSDKQLCPALVMLGDVGQGKTVAAAWCCVEWARDYPWNKLPSGPTRPPLVWLDGPRLRELSAFGDEAAKTLDDAARAELTVVDDAGRDGSPKAMESISDVLMERLDNRRQTILTSNLKGEQFRQRYGAALADRLRAYAVIPKLTGKSLRGQDARTP